ncbi:MAG: RbsD/FucU family protein [Opitutaceae bacterium]
MLKAPLLHPEILRALASAGHGSRVLIADGNYPLSTATPATASRVYLNLRPGCLTVTEVLATLATVLPIESALGMQTRDGAEAPIHGEIARLLGEGVPFVLKPRHDFYGEARSADTTLAIATGEQRRFANILLTIGVVRLPDDLL